MELLYEICQVHKWNEQMRAFLAYNSVHARSVQRKWIGIFYCKMVRIFFIIKGLDTGLKFSKFSKFNFKLALI